MYTSAFSTSLGSLSAHRCVVIGPRVGRPPVCQDVGVRTGCHPGRRSPSRAGTLSPQRSAMCTLDTTVDSTPGCLASCPRAGLPRHGVYPRIAVLVTCLGTSLSDSALLIAGLWERHLRRLHAARGPWWLRRLRSAPPRATALWSLVLSSPHAVRRLPRTRVTVVLGHLLLVGLILRHWAATRLSLPAPLSLHSVSGPLPEHQFLPGGAARASCLAGLEFDSMSWVFSRALRPSVSARCPSLFEQRCRVPVYFCPSSLRPLRATAPGRTGLFAACSGTASGIFTAWDRLAHPFPPHRHFPSRFALLSPAASFLSVITRCLSGTALGRASRCASCVSCCAGWQGAFSAAPGWRSPPYRLGHCIDADASLPWSALAVLRLSGLLSAAASLGAASSARPRPSASARVP